MPVPASFSYPGAAFFGGVRSALGSVFFPVLAGTYIGVGALAHDFAFSSWWLALSTVLVWAGPAQVILLSALCAGSAILEAAVAVTLTAIRLFPMVGGLAAANPAQGDAVLPTTAADALHLGQHVD